MSDDNDLPIPPKIQRGNWRWLLLLCNGGALAGMVSLYPQLVASIPALLDGSWVWMLLTAWGVLVMAHLLIVCVLEVREGVMIYTKQRAYNRQLSAYHRQRIKQRLGS